MNASAKAGLMFLLPATALAQSSPPAYDERADALVALSDGEPIELVVTDATVNPSDPVPPCFGIDPTGEDSPTPLHQTVWMQFEAKGTSAYVTTRNSRGDAPEACLAVYRIEEGELVQLASSDHPTLADSTQTSLCVEGLVSSETLYVMIAMPYAVQIPASVVVEVVDGCPGWKTAPCYAPDGTCSIKSIWDCSAANGFWHEQGETCFVGFCEEWEPNDTCGTAEPLGPDPEYLQIDNVCASNDIETSWFGLQSSCNRGIWYSVTGDGGQFKVTACSMWGEFETALAVFCGSCGSPDFLRFAVNNTLCGDGDMTGSSIEWCTELGVEYLVLVAGAGEQGNYGRIELTFEKPGPCDIPSVCCRPDVDHGGVVDADDIFQFLDLWFLGDLRADFDRSGVVNADDIFAFLDAWFAGC